MQLQYVINIFTTSKFITIVSTVVVVVTAQGTTDAVSVVALELRNRAGYGQQSSAHRCNSGSWWKKMSKL